MFCRDSRGRERDGTDAGGELGRTRTARAGARRADSRISGVRASPCAVTGVAVAPRSPPVPRGSRDSAHRVDSHPDHPSHRITVFHTTPRTHSSHNRHSLTVRLSVTSITSRTSTTDGNPPGPVDGRRVRVSNKKYTYTYHKPKTAPVKLA